VETSSLIDRLGSDNLAQLIVGGQINPALAANNVRVIKDTHGKTSQLTADDLEAYLKINPTASDAEQLKKNITTYRQ